MTLEITGLTWAYTEATIEAFEAANPGIRIEYPFTRIISEEGMDRALLTSGTGPDILQCCAGPGRVGPLARDGLIVNLDELYERQQLEDHYQAYVLDQLRAQDENGSLFEVSEGYNTSVWYYHADMFEDLGISDPRSWTSWDDFLGACEVISSAGITPVVVGARGNFAAGWMFSTLMEAAAGDDIMADIIYNEGTFNRPETLRGAEMLVEMVEGPCLDGEEAAALDFPQMEAAFLGRNAAMVFSSGRMLVEGEDEGLSIATVESFVLPSLDPDRPSRPIGGGVASWIVNAQSENLDAAMKWMEWVTSPEYLEIAIANGTSLIPTQVVPEGLAEQLHPALQDSLSHAANGVGYNLSVYFPAEGTQAWYDAMQGLLAGVLTPQEAVNIVEEGLVEARSR